MKFFCNAFAVLMAALCTASTASALPLTWRADWPDCKPVEKYVHRGTDVELQPQWYINGELANSTNWTFQTFVQTNAQATGEWFGPIPGTTFSHTNDVGAAMYQVMLRAQTPGGAVNYTAFARLRMLDSPGFTPGELKLPVAVLDFAQVEVRNAEMIVPDISSNILVASALYTDRATNSLSVSLSSQLSVESISATNYTDRATNALGQAVNTKLASDYYTAAQTDDAIDALAAYYITYTAAGAAFPTRAALTNATVVYSGGAARTPTRNDYAVVLADETHGGAEWRYIYTVAAGATSGQWDAQYPIETNDYDGLANKPQINGNTLTGNKTSAQLDVASTADATLTERGFSEWVFPGFPEIEEYIERDLVPVEFSQGIELEYRVREKNWETGEWDDWYLLSESDNYAPLNATSFTWLMPMGGEEPDEFSGTRTALPGYVLGSQTTKPLASEAEAEDLRTTIAAAALAATNYTDAATNALSVSLSSQLSVESISATNYTDRATNSLSVSLSSQLSVESISATNYTDRATNALGQAVNTKLTSDYYTAAQTDDAIDALAAYYITYTAAGAAFPTRAALLNATVVYSGGAARTPTRNDYAVVLADESHGDAEWRYIYTVAAGATSGQWDAQYPIETNDYDGLSNKPQINGVSLSGNQTAAQLGLATPANVAAAALAATNYTDAAASSVARSATNYTDRAATAATNYTVATVAAVATAATNYTNASISPTSPAFSNAVLSVGLGIDTNTVAAINELVDASHDLPITGATSVGALLLALAAAIAALKKNLRYSYNAASVTLSTTTDTNDTATVTSLADRAINMATLGSAVTVADVTLPAATAGYSRDFFVDLTIEATTAPTLTFIDPATNTTANVAFGADSLADIDTGYNLVLFTELPNNRWLVSVKHEEASS